MRKREKDLHARKRKVLACHRSLWGVLKEFLIQSACVIIILIDFMA